MKVFNSVSMGALAMVLGAGSLTFSARASAQETSPPTEESAAGLEEIIVTAQRRSENLQSVPISVTAISGDNLAAGGVRGLTEISQSVPSVQITRSAINAIFFIRGVGNSSGGTGEEGANAFYVDGVYLGDLAQAATDFNNIERIEVLKGPQGTLFGRNSSGGLVNIITREPGSEVVVKGMLGYGNYQTLRGQLYAAGPLSDTVSADIALTGKDQNNGFGTNLATGKDVQLGWNFGARSKWVFRPGDHTKIILSGDYYKSRDNYTLVYAPFKGTLGVGGAVYPGDYNGNDAFPPNPFGRNRVWGLALTVEQDLDWATLTSVTGHRNQRQVSIMDSDFTPAALIKSDFDQASKTFQQELRLASATTSPLSWQVGLFYYRAIADLNRQLITGSAVGGANSGFNLTGQLKTTSYAAFGEITYDLTESTHLTAGVRYTRDERRYRAQQAAINQTNPAFIAAFTVAPFANEATFNRPTWRLALRQDLTDDINIYGSYNRGFKSGSFAMNATPGTNPPIKPQTIDAFELGIKSQLFDNLLRLNVAGFHYKVKNYQVRSSGPTATALLLNAATVKVDGVEGELELAPTRELRLTANATYLNSRFASFPGALFYIPQPAVCNNVNGNPPGITTGPLVGGYRACFGNASGNRVPLAPKFAATLGATYRTPVGDDGELILTGQWTYTSRIYFETDNARSQASYSVLNASVEYRPSAHWGVELWAKNLGDKQYYVTANTAATGATGALAAPRTYGVNLKFDF